MNQEQNNLLKQNIHIMTKERLEELGWQFDDFWNNRAMFSMRDAKLTGFAIFEHDGDWGIMDPYNKSFSLIYCNMSDNDINEFTKIVKTFEDIVNNPKEHSFFEYLCVENDSKYFVKNMKERE